MVPVSALERAVDEEPQQVQCVLLRGSLGYVDFSFPVIDDLHRGSLLPPPSLRNLVGRWNCHYCKSSFNVLSGTIFQGTHLTLPGGKVKVTVEIEAEVPEGVSDDVQRVINENCQTLRFKSHGFEES